jgi:hypothetical protein
LIKKKDRDELYKKNDDLDTDISEKYKYLGKFILYSNFDIAEKDVLNLYYTREHIEQVFDISKNNASMLPLRTHKTDSTMGHLLLSFIASIISLDLNNKLKNTKYCAHGALKIMRDLSVTFKDDSSAVDPLMTTEKELAIILKLNLDYPIKIDLNKSYKNKYLNEYNSENNIGRPQGRQNRNKLNTKEIIHDNESDNNDTSIENDIISTIKPRRGRPPKDHQNKLTSPINETNTITNQIKQKLGRPKGSKNKPKLDNSIQNN